MNSLLAHLHVAFVFVLTHWKYFAPIFVWVVNDFANGLVKYPDEANFLRAIADRASVHSNSDSPGTFKPLFARSKAPYNRLQMPTDEHKTPVGTKVAAFLPFVFFLAALSACGPVAKHYELNYGTCMKNKGLAVLGTIPGQVDGILSNANSKDTAVADLDKLAIGGVEDAVICAVKAWMAGDSVLARPTMGAIAGQAFLDKHGVK